MNSPVLHWPEGHNYDCVSCGRGCRNDWGIDVEDRFVETISKHPLGLRVLNDNGAVFRTGEDGIRYIHLADKDNPRCSFLDGDNRCQVHSQLGMDEKPITCQKFPFHLTETPDGVYIGLSFFCTSVRENSGRPAQAHEEWLRQKIAAGAFLNQRVGDVVNVAAGHKTDWADYKGFEDELRRRVKEQGLELTIEQALVLTASAGSQRLPLAPNWPAFEIGESPLGNVMEDMLDTAVYALVKFRLQIKDPERLAVMDEAFQNSGVIEFPEYNWKGTWADFLRFQHRAVGERFEDTIDRWADMQLHRKAIVVPSSMLDNLWFLFVVPRMLRCLSALEASKHGRPEATLEDFYIALEDCEQYFGMHSGMMPKLATRFSSHLLEQLECYETAADLEPAG